jgi:hypothetical protein
MRLKYVIIEYVAISTDNKEAAKEKNNYVNNNNYVPQW